MTTGSGRLTLPIETGMDEEIRALVERLKPDAVRNSDGTELPEIARELVDKVYSTYFPSRGDHEWSRAHPDQRVNQYLMSTRTTAWSNEPLEIDVMDGYFAQQFAPDTQCDLSKYWQVIDRTTGEVLSKDAWDVREAPARPIDKDAEVANSGDLDDEASSAIVTIREPHEFHVYTVNFLARQIWDSTQIYNYLTNDWASDPSRLKDKTYDPAYTETWEFMQEALREWLAENPEVDVVRFTTFFYHFTLVFDERAREKYVDWFGYSAAVSVPALEAFAEEFGFELTPEDFVDAGYYNSSFRPPNPRFRQWIDFTSRRVAERAKVLVDQVHEAGREAIMFLGDNWMGTEPYGPYFPSIGLDGVVGSVGNAATCRMIADIPGVRYTEGRFLPYFFPDVFHEGGDPVGEANDSWVTARRAIIRNPLDRMGYGGYLSLALQHEDFVDRIEEIIGEFRELHDRTGGERPATSRIKVAILNAWGSLRSWQTHMIAHAKYYREAYTYLGVLESLAGLPFEVSFLSFDDVREGVPNGIDVVINSGSAGTAFSGGPEWKDADLQSAIRQFVARGGGLIGVGDPTAVDEATASQTGTAFALADVFGIDKERHWGLSSDRYPNPTESHFLTDDLPEDFDTGEGTDGIFALRTEVAELRRDRRGLTLAAHTYGDGRAVYAAGLPYSPDNSRLLHRAIYWAAGAEGEWDSDWTSSNAAVEVAHYPGARLILAANSDSVDHDVVITGGGQTVSASVPAMKSVWLSY